MSAMSNGSGGTGVTSDSSWSTDDPNSPGYKFTLPIGGDTTNSGITGMTTIPGYGSQGTQVVPTMGGATFGQSDADATSNAATMNIPQTSKTNWDSLMAAGSKLKMPDQGGTNLTHGGSARVSLKGQNFSAPVVALPVKAGSTAGQGLLAFMQKYRPGVETS